MSALRAAALVAVTALLWFASASRCLANGGDASAPTPAGVTLQTRYFGAQPAPGVELAVMDGGTHGVAGHRVELRADGSAQWTRRADGLAPHGASGSGRFEPSHAERQRLASWAEAAWALAGAGDGAYFPPVEASPPRRVWAVVVRRGDVVRRVEGGGLLPADAPPRLRPLLAWLVERVDALAARAEP